ncbi:MAG: leucyl/phenylalanyl-tRNA--protein transferase [Bacteroidota bacterium]|nr:leucyl/phenylalanyl-tRNA--protein transferase [Bacteroidota bacterium]
MAFFIPEEQTNFPPVELADADGLLAIGGSLSFERLINAYKNGIFPWYNEGEPACWYSPDPRFVLFPSKLKVSHSMKAVLKKNEFTFSIDLDFADVIRNCRKAKRKSEPGTWISDEIEHAYTDLFKKGFAHSAETWKNNKLIGGLYGVQMDSVFFGESMFASESNASKFAFINYVKTLEKQGVKLVDCQVYTAHLESLGAEFISRKEFISLLKKLIG